MAKKPQVDKWYQEIIDQYTPKKKLLRNCSVAFVGGGLLCALAELAHELLMSTGMSDQSASSWVTVAVIAIVGLLTGLGVYDKLAQKMGAGLAVPISGFANSVAASMLEHKYEGMVLGSGCNSFKLAGAVVVFGISSAFFVVCIAWIFGLI